MKKSKSLSKFEKMGKEEMKNLKGGRPAIGPQFGSFTSTKSKI